MPTRPAHRLFGRKFATGSGYLAKMMICGHFCKNVSIVATH